MITPRLLLLVGLFGAIGAICRYIVSELSLKWFGIAFPIATLTVNVLGCLMLGALAETSLTSDLIPDAWRIGIGIGFLGGLTTFSTFGHETFRHLQDGNLSVAAGSVAANLLLGLLAVWFGVSLARMAFS